MVAEYTLFMMLALVKQYFAYDRFVREGRWAARSGFAARDVLQKTLLIVGLGRIGREVVKRAAPAMPKPVWANRCLAFSKCMASVGLANTRAARNDPTRVLIMGLYSAGVIE